VTLLTKVLETWPHDVGVHQTLVQSYKALGQTELAEKHLALSRDISTRAEKFYNLQRQVIAHPNDAELRYLVGDTLAVQGLLDDASGWWRSALRLDPHHQPSHEAMAKYYAEKGDKENAAKHRDSAELSVPFTFKRAWALLQAGGQAGDPNAPNLILVRQLLPLMNQYPKYSQYSAVITAGLMNRDGKFSEALDTIYVIRQIPLTEAAAAGTSKPSRGVEGSQPGERPSPDRLIDIINELSTPEKKPGEAPKPANPSEPPKPSGSPGVFQPASDQPTKPADKPLIDLIEPGQTAPKPAAQAPSQPQPELDTGDTTWVYLNGQWVKVKRPAAAPSQGVASQPEGPLGQAAPTSKAPIVTQRVIRVPTQRLANGDARVNLVIRPGDVIRVPPQPSGNIFIGGQVQRAGTYQMIDKLTLTNALIAAGGLSSIAVQERVDLTRMVGNDRVATIRLNLRAIAERTRPS